MRPIDALELTGLSRAEFGVGLLLQLFLKRGLFCKATRQLSLTVRCFADWANH